MKALYKVTVKVEGADYPYVYQFDNGTAAWDFANEAEKMPHVVEVIEPNWPTKLYTKHSLGDALKDLMRVK
jgi:hypothetical protein